LYEPKGVCALITPWNWPINQVNLKVIPALASACTVVLKPSEIAPLSSMLLAEMIDEAKFPSGVFNLINGDGAITGNALTSHPDINMISFTGSTRAGALISQNAAKDFKRISLELGGKGANIIFKDADPEAIARGVLRCFRNSGQSCNAPTRMLVEKSIYDKTVEKVKELANSTKVDAPHKEGDHIGPVVSEVQINKIQIDTHHFKGNYPDKCSLQAAFISKKVSSKSIIGKSTKWKFLLNNVKLYANKKHNFRNKLMKNQKINYIKINIFPDGGISRIRAFGRVD